MLIILVNCVVFHYLVMYLLDYKLSLRVCLHSYQSTSRTKVVVLDPSQSGLSFGSQFDLRLTLGAVSSHSLVTRHRVLVGYRLG